MAPAKTEKNPKGAGRPPRTETPPEGSVYRGVKIGDVRYSTVLNAANLETLKDIAYTDRKSDKEVVNEAIEEYIKSWKAKGKKLVKRPQ